MTPTISLGRLHWACQGNDAHLHVVETRRLPCNPKRFWTTWREEVLRPCHDWRISTKELVVEAHARWPKGRRTVRVLVDTGAKIPLVFRKNLFPKTSLKKACFPVNFTTVDGQRMEGGNHGLFLELWLPVHRQGRLINARTCSLFAYEADIQGIDIIMGYPFLKVFNLFVDTEHDCLSLQPSSAHPQVGLSDAMPSVASAPPKSW